MPLAAEFMKQQDPLRIFAYGADHVFKTTWALQAAEAGFRVLLFNFDRGASVIHRIAPAALSRIFIIDSYDGVKDSYAAQVAVNALRSYDFWIHEETRQVCLHTRPGFSHIDMRDFGADTVVVIDSYTSLATSFQRDFAYTHEIDMADAAKPEWDGYAYCGRSLTWIISQIKAAPFHTITVGHKTTYEKRKKDATGKMLNEIEYTKDVPVSSSNPHALTITRGWDEVLTFSKRGSQGYISTEGDDESSGGSRILPPQIYKYEDLSFAALARLHGIATPKAVEPFVFEIGQALQPKIKPRILPQGDKTVTNKPVLSPAQNSNPLINALSG